LTAEIRERVINANQGANERAERTLAVAFKRIGKTDNNIDELEDEEIESGLVLLGFVGMIDPPKDGVREAVKKCHEAGISVVMITGDSRGTASAIARDLGVLKDGFLVVEGSDLPLDENKLDEVSVFCRVSPGQKVEIVNAYRKKGMIIAMTGDGINDAAALKNADVGVAMGRSGVDVAKEASQIILSDDNFATLVTAVHRGRQIFDNIQKGITYQIYTNLSELAIMFMGSLLFVEQMMGDKHLLFLYFSTHLFPVAALVLDRTTPSVMKEPPRNVKEGIVSRNVLGNLGIMIFTMTIFSLFAFYILDGEFINVGIESEKLETIQTMILTFVVSAECINLFNSLSMKDSLIKQVRERNMILPVLMALVPISALTFFMYTGEIGDGMDLVSLSPLQYFISLGSGFVIIPVVELFKIFIRRSERKRKYYRSFIDNTVNFHEKVKKTRPFRNRF
jgi:Ca2+-transporting ATPase